MMRRVLTVTALAVLAVLLGGSSAMAAEVIRRYDVVLAIQPSSDLLITETIEYDFDDEQRRGIVRDVPTRLHYDDTYDRLYPLEVVSVRSTSAPDEYVVEESPGGITRIRIGDPDTFITGAHVYEIVYRIRGGLNSFPDHDELYWNAVGHEWAAPIERAHVRVQAPATITEVACFSGPVGAHFSCTQQRTRGNAATFTNDGMLPFQGVTVVVALPPGSVPAVGPILEERLTLANAIGARPAPIGGAVALGVLAIGGVAGLLWTRGRDSVFRGSQIDEVMGGTPGQERRIPLGQADAAAPVEFAPPQDLRPGQVGTLIDEHANTLDVSATIVDLAVRGFLRIEEVPKRWVLGKPDWRFVRLETSDEGLLGYERTLLTGLFATGAEVELSALRNVFASKLRDVQAAMYRDVIGRGWFRESPDKVRARWRGIGLVALVLSIAATYLLATQLRLGIVGVPLVLASLLLLLGAKRMPARTAEGTALVRRIRGFEVVIDKAETHLSRWAEQEQVFTRYLPYAIVFGCTERWAKAFEVLGVEPDTSWYVSSRPFVYREFAHSIDGLSVTTSGTIASTPSGSGSSGFSGGSSGGGGGGGGGGSW